MQSNGVKHEQRRRGARHTTQVSTSKGPPACAYPLRSGGGAERRGGGGGGGGVHRFGGQEVFSRVCSHVIDVLKVARSGDQAGVMAEGGRIRGPRLIGRQKGRQGQHKNNRRGDAESRCAHTPPRYLE